VFPFIKFPGVATVLGPEMKSTGEVMGIDATFGAAFAKAQSAAGTLLPTEGSVFLSVPAVHYEAVVPIAQRLARLGFQLLATVGTGTRLRAAGLEVTILNKVQQGPPHVVDAIRRGEVALVVNTPAGAESFRDSFPIRRTTLECRVPYFTTIAAAVAAVEGIETIAHGPAARRHRRPAGAGATGCAAGGRDRSRRVGGGGGRTARGAAGGAGGAAPPGPRAARTPARGVTARRARGGVPPIPGCGTAGGPGRPMAGVPRGAR
jgi:carbamoyl-phosphate synthase large subunit